MLQTQEFLRAKIWKHTVKTIPKRTRNAQRHKTKIAYTPSTSRDREIMNTNHFSHIGTVPGVQLAAASSLSSGQSNVILRPGGRRDVLRRAVPRRVRRGADLAYCANSAVRSSISVVSGSFSLGAVWKRRRHFRCINSCAHQTHLLPVRPKLLHSANYRDTAEHTQTVLAWLKNDLSMVTITNINTHLRLFKFL